MRIPFIVHWPKGMKSGQVNDWLINNTDFAPAILTLAGGKTPFRDAGQKLCKNP